MTPLEQSRVELRDALKLIRRQSALQLVEPPRVTQPDVVMRTRSEHRPTRWWLVLSLVMILCTAGIEELRHKSPPLRSHPQPSHVTAAVNLPSVRPLEVKPAMAQDSIPLPREDAPAPAPDPEPPRRSPAPRPKVKGSPPKNHTPPAKTAAKASRPSRAKKGTRKPERRRSAATARRD
jgi:hypothetical protein